MSSGPPSWQRFPDLCVCCALAGCSNTKEPPHCLLLRLLHSHRGREHHPGITALTFVFAALLLSAATPRSPPQFPSVRFLHSHRGRKHPGGTTLPIILSPAQSLKAGTTTRQQLCVCVLIVRKCRHLKPTTPLHLCVCCCTRTSHPSNAAVLPPAQVCASAWHQCLAACGLRMFMSCAAVCSMQGR